jgi:hypothetical protein
MKKVIVLFIFSFIFACDDSNTINQAFIDAGTDSKITDSKDQSIDQKLTDMMFDQQMSDMQKDMNTTQTDDRLCLPCDDRQRCDEGYFCTDESYCSKSCIDTEDCPTDYECKSTDAGSSYCAPKDGKCGDVLCNDADGDEYGRGPDCKGLDCDDNNPNINPGIMRDACDAIDNDCDGIFDENFESNTCGSGACAGSTACVMGLIQCQQAVSQGNDDNCNAIDEDCDGNIDEAYQSTSCGQGACAVNSTCQAGIETCLPLTPAVGTLDNTCDLIDNDCNGLVDDGFIGATCGVGVCLNQATCSAQGQACEPRSPLSDDRACNGDDDDCDGSVDEAYQSDVICGLGACLRTQTCQNATEACIAGDPLTADDRTCDGIDDNCNGFIDENCANNALQFQVVENGPDYVIVAIVLNRGMERVLNRLTLPQSADLRISYDPRISYVAQSGTLSENQYNNGYRLPTIIPSIGANKTRFPLTPPLNATEDIRLVPGEILRMRFTVPVGTTRPLIFNWLVAESYTDLNQNGRYDFCIDQNNDGNCCVFANQPMCDPNLPLEPMEPFTDDNQNQQRDANTLLAPIEAQAIVVLENAQLN